MPRRQAVEKRRKNTITNDTRKYFTITGKFQPTFN
jgi:hypothetical protein